MAGPPMGALWRRAAPMLTLRLAARVFVKTDNLAPIKGLSFVTGRF